jgi:hypothetical protein
MKADQTELNPLADLIQKLSRQVATSGPKHAAYELGILDVDIPIYDPCSDGRRTMGGPCLSHLSFKLKDDARLVLTAFYRSHHYIRRALGNLFGLAWLQHFVATRSDSRRRTRGHPFYGHTRHQRLEEERCPKLLDNCEAAVGRIRRHPRSTVWRRGKDRWSGLNMGYCELIKLEEQFYPVHMIENQGTIEDATRRVVANVG